jgi:hypothetical protein
VLGALLCGCYAPEVHNGDLHCSADNRCPSGFDCALDNTCWAQGQFPDLGNPDSSPVALQPAGLTIAPLTADFGSVAVGQYSVPISFTVTNIGDEVTPDTLAAAVFGYDPPSFVVESDTCSTVFLAPHEACVVTLIFTPLAPTHVTATLAVTNRPGSSQKMVEAEADLAGDGN